MTQLAPTLRETMATVGKLEQIAQMLREVAVECDWLRPGPGVFSLGAVFERHAHAMDHGAERIKHHDGEARRKYE
jgi:hypothetical protein